VFAEALVKAAGKSPGPDKKENERAAGPLFAEAREQAMSLLVDPYAWHQGSMEFHRRPSMLGWGTLRRMARQPLIAAVLQTRINQAAAFTRFQENRYLPGYRIRMRGTRRAPRQSELRMMEDLARFVAQLGVATDPRVLQHRPSFTNFTKAVIRDSLTYDQGTAEIIPSKAARLGGIPRPARVQWTDAATMRIAQTALDGHGLPEDDFTTPRFVQIYQDTVVAQYPTSRMMFGVRNPDTSIYSLGYGLAELEMLIRVLTAWLNAFDRNHKYFTQGFNARGILNLQGSHATEAQIRGLKRELQLLTAGVQGAHRLAVTQAEGLQFVNAGNEAQDMQWGAWADMLIKVACAVFLMDPAEINFTFGNTGQTAAMGSASMAEKVEASRERGLVPLVTDYFDWLNRCVIWALDSDFELEATGVRRRDEKDDLELDKLRASFGWTVDEIRARNDEPGLPDGQGDVILDPTWLQHAQAAAAAEEEGGDASTPLDTADLFGVGGVQEQGSAAEDAGEESPDVIPDEVPLAASQRGRVRTTIEL